MTIKEFTNLTFHEASEHLRKIRPGKRLGTYENFDDFKKDFGFSDSVWTEKQGDELSETGQDNTALIITDKWYITKLRFILKLRYSKDISINYHIGNTSDGMTLKEISFQGIGNYWKETFPELENLSLNKEVCVKIPLVTARNGRKGTVSDMLQNHFGMLKLKLDVAIQEMADYIRTGEFAKVWNEAIESNDGTTTSRYNYYRNVSTLEGILGNHTTSLIADAGNFSLREVVCFLKYEAGYVQDFYPVNHVLEYFGSEGPYYRSYTTKSMANFEGLSQKAVDEIKNLSIKIQKYLDLDTELNSLRDAIQVSYDSLIKQEELVFPKTQEQLRDLLDMTLRKNIDYNDLEYDK